MFGNIISSITALLLTKKIYAKLIRVATRDFSLVMSGRYELLYFSIPTLHRGFIYLRIVFLLSGWGKILRLI